MSSTSAVVTVTAPAISKHRAQPVSLLSGNSCRLNASTARPAGMLMKNTPCQPNAAVTGPPSSSPAVAPTPPMPPQIPSALLRSGPSGNTVSRIDSAVGAMIAAETPCTTRAPSSAAAEQQQATKTQQVTTHHPLHATGGKPQVPGDLRQGDVNDRPVQDHHEKGRAQHGERQPAAQAMCRSHRPIRPPVRPQARAIALPSGPATTAARTSVISMNDPFGS